VYTYSDGRVYEGSGALNVCIVRGKVGCMSYSAMSLVSSMTRIDPGEYRQGKRHSTGPGRQGGGKSVYKYADGRVYEVRSSLCTALRHKTNQLTSPRLVARSHRIACVVTPLQGQFINDKMVGPGVYKYKNGDTVEGEWKNGHFEPKAPPSFFSCCLRR
jgi:hypothetical protein